MRTIDEDQIFERFTNHAQRAIINSYDFARKDSANEEEVLQPKHLFAAILLDKDSFASRLLEKLSLDVDATAEAILGEPVNNFTSKGYVPNEDYKRILAEAFVESANLSHVYVGSEHILLAMMKFNHLDFIDDLTESGLSYDKIKSEILKFGTYQPGVFSEADHGGEGDSGGGDSEAMKKAREKAKAAGRGLSPMGRGTMGGGRPGSGSSRQRRNSGSNSALEFFGRNMIELAEEGKYFPIFGREEEIERVIHILSRQSKNNPILVGEPGVGKTAIVEGLAQKAADGDLPPFFDGMEIIQVDMASIVAGAKVRGDVEERLMAIMKEVQESENKILFIDEIHTIIGAGSTGGSSDVANMLKPYLTDTDMRIIGATTNAEYSKYFEEEGALSRRFQPVDVDELNVESTIELLKFLRPNFEDFHKVKVETEALEAAAKLSKRYIADRHLPDKAIDLVDEAAAKKKIHRSEDNSEQKKIQSQVQEIEEDKSEALDSGDLDKASKLREKEIEMQDKLSTEMQKSDKISKSFAVNVQDIREVISIWTKIPVASLTAFEVKSVKDIEKKMKDNIIGQQDAITRVAGALKRSKLGFTDENRPLASMLLLGPTGVGKTETAKVIANELYGDEDALIQINMSEFMEQHSVSKLIGAPPGYVGYSDGNHITEQVRKKPYSVVLFDEIEKAHVDTLNILLQILEEGEIQDSKGRKVSFKNTVVIMTSNIGAKEIAKDDTLGFSVEIEDGEENKLEEAYEEMREQVMAELKDHLRPEFINRIDEIIVYRGLNKEDMSAIAELQLEDLNRRLAERMIKLDVTPAVIKKIAEDGYSEEFGARNIRRKIQEVLENQLADFILEEKLINKLQKLNNKKSAEPLEIHVAKRKDDVIFEQN